GSGTLAFQLRMQLRRSFLEPGVARASTSGSGLAAGQTCTDLRTAARRTAERSMGGAERLHPGGPRPLGSIRGIVLCRSCFARTGRSGAGTGFAAARDAAARNAHVHELRMVLRRTFRT